jgi:hypothetical protein
LKKEITMKRLVKRALVVWALGVALCTSGLVMRGWAAEAVGGGAYTGISNYNTVTRHNDAIMRNYQNQIRDTRQINNSIRIDMGRNRSMELMNRRAFTK